jgi:hypothetical protein
MKFIGSKYFPATAIVCSLTWPPVHATPYTFPGATPASCHEANSPNNGQYTCTVTLLAGSDRVTINAPMPATLSIATAFTTGQNSVINDLSYPSNLLINVSGPVSLGNDSTLNANITTSGATGSVNLADRVLFFGSINASSHVVLGRNVKIFGYIKATGNVTLGSGSKVIGPIDALAVSLAENSMVTDLILAQGDVNLGTNAQVSTVSTSAGNITVQETAKISGALCNRGAGSITQNTATADVMFQGSEANSNPLCPTQFSPPTANSVLPHKISSRTWRQIFLRQ